MRSDIESPKPLALFVPSVAEYMEDYEGWTESNSICLRARRETRIDLAGVVYQRTGRSREKAHQLLAMMLIEIIEELSRGGNVKLSSIGTFFAHSNRERARRNPKTGVEASISPRDAVVFKTLRILVDRLNTRLPLEQRFTA